jgi:hypothetical protein
MPALLILFFLLLQIVHTAMLTMALQNALSQTVQLSATAWHAVTMAQADGHQTGREDQGTAFEANSSRKAAQLQDVRQTISEMGPWLPMPLREWAQEIANGRGSLEAEAARLVLEQLMMQMHDTRILDESRLELTAVTLPDNRDTGQAYITAEVAYRLPFRYPWHDRSPELRISARERAWVGGLPSRARAAEPQAAPLAVTFVSLEPNPVRPGRKATLVLETEPGAVLDLSVIYKSGRSQAKHLGTAVADVDGKISWTWHVSGNTTSGEWHWEVTGAGGATHRQTFRVDRLPTDT